jgi:hypothetical protein
MLSPASRRAVSVGLMLLLSLSLSFAQDPPKDIEM